MWVLHKPKHDARSKLTHSQVSGRFYNFSNIRYAQSPDGDLRFRLPKSPETRSSKIDNGSVGRMCPQSHPAWLKPQIQFMNAYLTGQPCDVSTLQDQRNQAIDLVPPADSRETEDCLFLDVVVPDDIFRRRRRKDIPGGKPPVLVWIHGGGYAEGDKTGGGQFDPSGLFYRARAIGHDSFVFVALNYRVMNAPRGAVHLANYKAARSAWMGCWLNC